MSGDLHIPSLYLSSLFRIHKAFTQDLKRATDRAKVFSKNLVSGRRALIIASLASTRVFSFPRKIIGEAVTYGISRRNGVILFYKDPARAKVINLIKQIKNETEMLLQDNEAYQIFMAVRRTAKIKGDIAEVGVYNGGSAKLICEAKESRYLHLFDTFDGLPDLCEIDNPSQFCQGKFRALFEDVKNYLRRYSNVYIYKGLFPTTAEPIRKKKFSFVHLDVDLYRSTLNCLEFFYSRMSKGGVIISHDYIDTPGVRKAFDEFFTDKPEPIIELSGSQCMIVKT